MTAESHTVSPPVARSPGSFVSPAGQGTQAFISTRSSAPHMMGSHVVSPIDASSPAAFVAPASHATQTFASTF